MESRVQNSRPYLFLALWTVSLLCGLIVMAAYANSPAKTTPQPGIWPAMVHLRRIPGRPTLITLLHPKCPCSGATLEELSRLLAHTRAPIDLQFLLFEPESAPAQWLNSSLVSQARAFRGATIIEDRGGYIASNFGLSVSGQTALYAPGGKLLFSGGVTASRGHAGDNAGQAGIEAILLGFEPATRHTPVFGCSIRNQS